MTDPLPGMPQDMARGEHPERTPVYGGALIVAAMVGSTVVTLAGAPAWLRFPVYIASLLAAAAGSVMTLRDYS